MIVSTSILLPVRSLFQFLTGRLSGTDWVLTVREDALLTLKFSILVFRGLQRTERWMLTYRNEIQQV